MNMQPPVSLNIKGRTYHLIQDEKGEWHVRREHGDFRIRRNTHITSLNEARIWARQFIEKKIVKNSLVAEGNPTVAELMIMYLDFPKQMRDYVADDNVSALRRIVEVVFQRDPSQVRASELDRSMWVKYAAFRHGGRLDLSTPRPENSGILCAIRQARRVFTSKLEWHYHNAGVKLDFNELKHTPPLPVAPREIKPVPQDIQARLYNEWMKLRDTNPAMHTVIGLAWFCGLRAGEVMFSRREWLVQENGFVRVVLRDRLAEGFRTKTGKLGSCINGICLDEGFAQWLLDRPYGFLVAIDVDRRSFVWYTTNTWIRQFLPKSMSQKGLHRLRGLYADAIRERFSRELAAEAAGIKLASLALGHTNVHTTTNHYLTHGNAPQILPQNKPAQNPGSPYATAQVVDANTTAETKETLSVY